MLSVPELTTCSTSFFGEPWEGPCWNLAVVGILGGFVWALLHLGLSLTVFTWATGRAKELGKDQAKAIQQLSELVTYSVMFAANAMVVPFSPCLTDTDLTARCLPPFGGTSVLSESIVWVFMVEMSANVQMILFER